MSAITPDARRSTATSPGETDPTQEKTMVSPHAWIAIVLLLVMPTAAAARAETTSPRGDLQQRRLQPAPRPDFASVRQAADAMAATQEGPFRLHQVEVELRSTTLEIERAAFHYFRKTSRGVAPG